MHKKKESIGDTIASLIWGAGLILLFLFGFGII